jgi:hypothetical protein
LLRALAPLLSERLLGATVDGAVGLLSSSQALQMTLNENVYNPKKVSDWTNSVIDQCLKGLQALGKPFKYVGAWRGVVCVVV